MATSKRPGPADQHMVDMDHYDWAQFIEISRVIGPSAHAGRHPLPRFYDLNPYTFEIEADPRLIRYRIYRDKPDRRR